MSLGNVCKIRGNEADTARWASLGVQAIPFSLVAMDASAGCRGVFRLPPPPPCRSPPLVVPQGGVGDRHLVNPKFFVAAHCVVVWVTVLWGTATCIPCTHGGHFAYFR